MTEILRSDFARDSRYLIGFVYLEKSGEICDSRSAFLIIEKLHRHSRRLVMPIKDHFADEKCTNFLKKSRGFFSHRRCDGQQRLQRRALLSKGDRIEI
jgi:hypothetical protein